MVLNTKIKIRIGGLKVLIIDRKLQSEYPVSARLTRELNLPNNWLNQKLFGDLSKKTKFGESRDLAKKQAIQEHKENCVKNGEVFRLVDVRIDGIYSHSTFKNYMMCGSRFNNWLIEEKGVINANSMKQVANKYGVEYLKDLESKDYSPYTIRQAKSFLGKITGKEIDYKLPVAKERQEITKGRSLSKRSRSFREDLNRDLVAVAKGTGGRRSDLANLKLGDFVEEKGLITGVNFIKSKGGRNRYTPVLPEYQAEITKLVAELKRQGKTVDDNVFKTVNSKANIHAYRREYARDLYNLCNRDNSYRDYVLEEYKANNIEYTSKREKYNTKDGRVFDRKSLFVSSQALGHNRLCIITSNYFK